MSKYTRSLPLPIISLLNERRDLIYNENFPNMVMAGHALCVSKAKRTALACAHDEAQLSKRKTIGFYKDPELSAEDITYGLLAYYYLQDSRVSIEQFMDAFDVLVDSVPELESANVSSVQSSASVNEHEALSVSESETRANVSEALSERVSVREREHAIERTPEKASDVTSSERKTKAKTTTEKRKKKAEMASDGKSKTKTKKRASDNVRVCKYESTSVDDNPHTYIPVRNFEGKQVADYLQSLDIPGRSKVIEDVLSGVYKYNFKEYTHGNKVDDYKEDKARKMRMTRSANALFMKLKGNERSALVYKIYEKKVKDLNK